MWAQSLQHPMAVHWRAANPDLVLSRYIVSIEDDLGNARDNCSLRHRGNASVERRAGVQCALDWFERHHPEWVLYACDRKTPAWFMGIPGGHRKGDVVSTSNINIPLDFSNGDVINWQIDSFVKPALAQGADAIALDNFGLVNGINENYQNACGVWKGRGEDRHWVQLYDGLRDNGTKGSIVDPRYTDACLFWMSEFYDRVRALNASHPPLVIPNFSLEDIYDPYTCANERGDGTECAWNSEAMFVMGNHTDGLLSEAGFTAFGTRLVDGSEWYNKIMLMLNLQRHGKAYMS